MHSCGQRTRRRSENSGYNTGMKTATTPALARFRMVRHAVAVFTVAALAPWQASAVNPPPDVLPPDAGTAPGGTTVITSDPHLAYLESLDTRSAPVLARSVAVRTLLDQREATARQFAQASAEARGDIARAMERLDEQLGTAEAALEAALATTTPGDGPMYVAPPPLDIEGMRASAVRRRRAVHLPVPQPAALPALAAAPREVLYLDYLTVRAGNSEFARHLVEDASRLLRQRRELSYRHFFAPADDRAALEAAIAAASERLRTTTRGVIEASSIKGW